MELRFKVGDRATLANGDWGPKGTEVTVVEVDLGDPSLPYNVQIRHDLYRWVPAEALEPVSPQSRGSGRSLSVGDRVRVIDRRPSDASDYPSWNPHMDKTLGREGVVVRNITSDCYRVEFPDGVSWSYRTSWLTLVESDSKPRPPFKPGDRVRVKPREWFDRQPEDTWRAGFVNIGKGSEKETLMGREMTIERYDKCDNTYRANDVWWRAEWLEPAEPGGGLGLAGLIGSIRRNAEAVCGLSSPRQPQTTGKLPLINSNRLLTEIKLN